jgi:hypothetical protein
VAVRWDPKTRAGAVAVRVSGTAKSAEAVSKTVTDWARYQNLTGELDNVETSPVTGTYDWRGYLQEETEAAKRRAPPAKKAEKPAAPAPTDYYI